MSAAHSCTAVLADGPADYWDPALPTFDDLTPEERDAERADGTASPFYPEFILGYCPECGDDAIATEDGTEHFGCGAQLRFSDGSDDGTYWLEAS